MTARARIEPTKPGSSGKVNEKGGGYADARGGAAGTKRKTARKSSEKTRGGYIDAKAARAKPAKRQSGRSSEKTLGRR